jgi:hypothetical protein
VYVFYSEAPGVGWNNRRHVVADFGTSEFGYHPDRKKGYVGRHVDLLSRALAVEPGTDPVVAVRDWLANSHNKTPTLLRQKGVIGVYPPRYRGRIIWDPEVDLHKT